MAKYPHWLAVQDGALIMFANLPHLIAKAIHPADDVLDLYGIARVSLEAELRQAALTGELPVRNPLSLGVLPSGASLQNGVLLPYDLAPFLERRGIELRLIPYGSGPELWTLDNAALAIAEQQGWTSEVRENFLDQIAEAANARTLVVRHPHTDLPVNNGTVRTFYELTTPHDVNKWLASIRAPYRWEMLALDDDAIEVAPAADPEETSDADSFFDVAKALAGNTKLGKRERQIALIELVIQKFQLKPMQIPDGWKKKIEEECKRIPTLFGAGHDPFRDAWKEALKQNRVRMANHRKYTQQ